MGRSRAFCFTLNNYTDEDEARIAAAGAQYTLYGKEVGEAGTPHLQGYLYFKNQRTLKSVHKKLVGAHVEPRRGTHEQASEYCKKDGDYVEYGIAPEKNGGDSMASKIERNKRIRDTPLNQLVEEGVIDITQVRKIKNAKLDLAQENQPYVADGTRGHWFYGPPGTGKTHYARHEWGEAFYIKAQNKWFDGYVGQETIVLDDLDKGGACLGHYLKIWADKWACTGEVKGGQVNLTHRRFIVTSNYTIEELWPEDLEMQRAISRRFERKSFLIKYTE